MERDLSIKKGRQEQGWVQDTTLYIGPTGVNVELPENLKGLTSERLLKLIESERDSKLKRFTAAILNIVGISRG